MFLFSFLGYEMFYLISWDMRCFINIGLGDKCEKGFGKISNKYKKGEKYI